MSNQIELLLELQEMDIILAEAKIVHGEGKKSESVGDKMSSIRRLIDENTLVRYDRLIRQGLAVVQEKNSMCRGCNLSIPVGDLNRIRAEKTDPNCPNCGRFLVVS